LGPNILLSTLFSNTLNLCSSLIVRDQVSHPYKTTGKIYSFPMLIFILPFHRNMNFGDVSVQRDVDQSPRRVQSIPVYVGLRWIKWQRD
jgi:hypothetical protein